MLNEIFQILLLITNGITVWYITRGELVRGATIGLISEIFWFGTSWTSGQWSIFILTFWYCWCYGKVVYDNYKRKTT